ncbi:hypothetical protein [Mycobacterium sp. 852014-50255_SCH5639931]|uniref:hypothetical protein n=1 Tax=Mycobacterium sp. 852014-50255_SCH5639931 TaxID=1834112 RepID=UPI000AE53C2D|nr:hypothetical protein [Mycobacterium sp. 852014-50255_SCH5639931]
MPQPHPHYRQPYGYPQAYPPVARPVHAPAHRVPQAGYPPPPPTGNQPLFQVRIRKHTGAIILMFNQTYTVTGTFAQCEAALHDALLHNLLAGWWSMASILGWNWFALLENHNARKNLRRQAAQAYAAARPAPWTQSAASPRATHG